MCQFRQIHNTIKERQSQRPLNSLPIKSETILEYKFEKKDERTCVCASTFQYYIFIQISQQKNVIRSDELK